MKDRVFYWFLFVLMLHISHVFEEVWGRFFLIDAVYGLGLFLVINAILLSIPGVLFYFVMRASRRAYWLSMGYAAIMVVNGIGHNIATLATGWYFGGFAGGVTGILLAVAGIWLILVLWREMPRKMERAGTTGNG